MPHVTFTTSGALRKSALRLANERLVLNAVRRYPGISRAEVSRITGLPPSSVTYIVRQLRRKRLVQQTEVENHTRVGRRPTELHLRSESRSVVAVEITAKEARIALADLSGHIRRTRSEKWQSNCEVFFGRLRSHIGTLTKGLARKDLLGVGVALPGTIDRTTGQVIAAENLGWYGVEAGRLLQGQLTVPFYYENNAAASALAEQWFSDSPQGPLRNFLSITMHGGIGTGLVINGQLVHGATYRASEFGHMILRPDGLRCPCGNTGCWEQYASEAALSRLYRERTGRANREGDVPGSEAIIQMARNGDSVALEALRETAKELGLGLVTLISGLNPEAIILDGYPASAWDLIEETLWGVIRSRVPSYSLAGVRIFPSRHGPNSVLLGAVALVLGQFFNVFNHDNPSATSSPVSIVPHRG